MRLLRRRKHEPSPGDDSFLDIIANLVGVLIILVVVVGAHAGAQIRAQAVGEVDQNQLALLTRQFREAAETALNRERDNHQLEQQIDLEVSLNRERRTARNRLLVEVEAAKRELENRKMQLSQEHQSVFDQQDRLRDLSTQFEDLNRRYTSLKSVSKQNQTIEHFPTPIAKTVFSDEVHFRLLDGKILRVPLDELIELMRNEWREKAKKLDVSAETIETVGPVDNFRLQYRLAANEEKMLTPYGEMVRRSTEFTRFVLVPVNDEAGQPLNASLQTGSSFQQQISRLDPAKTTVSLWVYPNSFAEFNQLKKWLYQRGFQTACWPLSNGNLISGGPNGYRSTAQ